MQTSPFPQVSSKWLFKLVIESPVRSGFLPFLALTETLTSYGYPEFSNYWSGAVFFG